MNRQPASQSMSGDRMKQSMGNSSELHQLLVLMEEKQEVILSQPTNRFPLKAEVDALNLPYLILTHFNKKKITQLALGRERLVKLFKKSATGGSFKGVFVDTCAFYALFNNDDKGRAHAQEQGKNYFTHEQGWNCEYVVQVEDEDAPTLTQSSTVTVAERSTESSKAPNDQAPAGLSSGTHRELAASSSKVSSKSNTPFSDTPRSTTHVNIRERMVATIGGVQSMVNEGVSMEQLAPVESSSDSPAGPSTGSPGQLLHLEEPQLEQHEERKTNDQVLIEKAEQKRKQRIPPIGYYKGSLVEELVKQKTNAFIHVKIRSDSDRPYHAYTHGLRSFQAMLDESKIAEVSKQEFRNQYFEYFTYALDGYYAIFAQDTKHQQITLKKIMKVAFEHLKKMRGKFRLHWGLCGEGNSCHGF